MSLKALRAATAALLVQACAPMPEAPSEAIPEASTEAPAAAKAERTVPPPPLTAAERREIRDRLRGIAGIDRTAQVDDLWERIRLGFGM